MPAAPPAPVTAPLTASTAGRHRRPDTGAGRVRRAARLAGRAGSMVSLAALALLGTAVATNLVGHEPAERPTVTVTFDVAP